MSTIDGANVARAATSFVAQRAKQSRFVECATTYACSQTRLLRKPNTPSPTLAAETPEFCLELPSLSSRGRRESRVPDAPAASRAVCSRTRALAPRYTGKHPAFPAQWFYGFLRDLPGDRLFCHRHPRKLASAKLDASIGASGPHDFAVRNQARSSVARLASTASHRTFVTIARRPSHRARRRRLD